MDEARRRWIEQAASGRIKSSFRHDSGSSRATTMLEIADASGDIRQLVLREETGDGPVSGTELTLAREALVYRALADSAVAIPKLVAEDTDGQALLVERCHGSDNLDALDPAERSATMNAYAASLAELHLQDPDRLKLPGFHRPRNGPDHARGELALWRRILDARVVRPAPLARFAFGWLERHAPPSVERTVLCHGDAGPGNFLHREGRITALLDWEFAHLGDPMDDLGWLSFRGHHMTADAGDLAGQLRTWADATGLPVDPGRIAYYRAFVMLRWLVSCLAALDSGAASLDRSVYLSLVPLMQALLPRALAELAGVALEPVDPLPEVAPSGQAEVLAALSSDIHGVLLPELAGEAARRARGASLLLLHLRAADQHDEPLRRWQRVAMNRWLREPCPDLAAGRRALEAEIARCTPDQDAEWIRWFAEDGTRRMALWPYLVPLANKPLASIDVA